MDAGASVRSKCPPAWDRPVRNAVVAEMAIVGVDLATATAVADHAERATAIVEIRPVAVAIGDVNGRAGWKALSRRDVGRLAKSREVRRDIGRSHRIVRTTSEDPLNPLQSKGTAISLAERTEGPKLYVRRATLGYR